MDLKCAFFLSTIRENFLIDADDSDTVTTLSSLIGLADKMEKNEVQSGCCWCPCYFEGCHVICFIVFVLLTCYHKLQPDIIMFNCRLSDLQWFGAGP